MPSGGALEPVVTKHGADVQGIFAHVGFYRAGTTVFPLAVPS